MLGLSFLLLCNVFIGKGASTHAQLPQAEITALILWLEVKLGDWSQNGTENWQWQVLLQSPLIRASVWPG